MRTGDGIASRVRARPQPNRRVADDSGIEGILVQFSLTEDIEDGVVHQAAREAAPGIDYLLKQLVLGVAAVHHVKPPGLKMLSQDGPLAAVGLGDSGRHWHALEQLVLQVSLDPSMIVGLVERAHVIFERALR